MNRKDFLKQCGLGCLGGFASTTGLQSCGSSKTLSGQISGDDLILATSSFATMAGVEKHYKKYVLINNDILRYPVCVYRHSETEYTALWMKCTHQGAELQVFGDKLQCPAHGSEFGSRGQLQTGPASVPLRTFPVRLENELIKISLKAI